MTAEGMSERTSPGLHVALLGRVPKGLARDAAILDVGCGTGAWLSRLHSDGYTNLAGIDQDIAQVRFSGARVTQVDLNQSAWSAVSGPFDLITAIEVVEHVENLGIFFGQVSSLLSPGGSILMTTPNIESLAARMRFLLLGQLKQFDSLGDRTHLIPVVRHTLPRIVSRHGLRIADSWGYPSDGRTLTSRGSVNVLSRMLRTVLPEPIPGDNLCLLMNKL